MRNTQANLTFGPWVLYFTKAFLDKVTQSYLFFINSLDWKINPDLLKNIEH